IFSLLICILTVAGAPDALAQDTLNNMLKDTAGFRCDFNMQHASFPGGGSSLSLYLRKHIVYPQEAEDVMGKVYVSFFVGEDGTISDIKVVRSLHPALDKIAVDIVAGMPAWTPARVGNTSVKTRYTLPVKFTPE
ncbi:MAG: energy transducer TonB, partial [Sphingobacteriales bacterium]